MSINRIWTIGEVVADWPNLVKRRNMPQKARFKKGFEQK
ncbi:hypothetical protein CRL705_1186 [Latilactobacillus curvatus CRL 705]|nr:hypothetical protein CRL705_1186 [Latilactobacillus curvatus CRL 705]